ncbi:MAG: serine hydrolase [Candidatus Ancaeobacter aquaticus]|nr:serine hydrolase [Candidatus Ancaeobacter aquaticus]
MIRKIKKLMVYGVATMLYIICLALPLYADKPTVTAKSALIYDITSGEVLYEKNPFKKLPCASNVKIITAMVVADRSHNVVTAKVSKKALRGLNTRIYLNKGVEYTINDLLYALLLESSNDAANVLGVRIAGSVNKFTKLMNQKAAFIGAKKTKFANPSGLTDKKVSQYTTVHDLNKMMIRFLKYPQLYKIMKKKHAYIKGSDGKRIKLRNHNKLLKRFPNTIIGKTGYTSLAKHCFVGFSTVPGKRYVFVILGSKKPWTDMTRLLAYAKCIKKKPKKSIGGL